ncbi:DUF3095 domain-containing protein [Bowmanella sp. JS7-9]|uniref:DUF3095 domain-containing protein n=1 Tax=Pseudobowmanella zhangzhouensis TaxID=1537679 RepID=A0ABW1XFS9_9ALTE|nr:DUF3095 domain-containing protein [Bowmanella sp. JS7-9]
MSHSYAFANKDFYQRLPAFDDFSEFASTEHYTRLPAHWHVVVADIQGSTRAIEAGRYKAVNALGGACIVAVLNAVKPLKIPFIFGGDGATFCVPEAVLPQVTSALLACQQLAQTDFALGLRAGSVPIEKIREAGFDVLVAKFTASAGFEQAMFSGGGISYADALIKAPSDNNPYLIAPGEPAHADFSGFECRWNEVPSPKGETIALLVQAKGDHVLHEATYKRVMSAIQMILGDEQDYHPLREESLTLTLQASKLRYETAIRTFGTEDGSLGYRLKLLWLAVAGKWLMWRQKLAGEGKWGLYKGRLVQNSDFRKYDDILRMIVAVTPEQRQQLVQALEEEAQAGTLAYGLHASRHALITCMIDDYETAHMHFLDGAAGGYALAAKALKQQLQTNS